MFASRQVRRINCLQTKNSVALVFKAGSLSRQPLRHAATTAKPRAKKVSPAGEDSVSVPKKALSTKSAAATFTKSPKKKTAATLAVPVSSDAPAPSTTAKKSTRTAATKTTPVSTKPLRPSEASAKKPTDEPKPAVTSKARSSKPEVTGNINPPPGMEPIAMSSKTVAKTTPSTTGPTTSSVESRTRTSGQVPRPSGSTSPTPITPRGPAVAQAPHQSPSSNLNSPPKTDPASSEFKRTSRKVTSVIVALPILLVTSYYLFERLVLGNQPKRLSDFRSPEVPSAALDQDKN